MNKYFAIGNLVKNVELKYSQAGKAYAKISIAINEGYGDKKTTSFINLLAFDKTAENAGKFLIKGSKIAVECHVKTGSYDKQDGTKAYTTDFIVDKLEFLDSKGQAKGQKAEFDDDVFTPTDEDPFDISEDSIPF